MTEEGTVNPIIINSSGLQTSAFNNTYKYTFPSGSVTFNKSKVAVGEINMYYSWFNISATNNNNSYQIIWPTFAGSTTYTVTMPDGFYDIGSINTYLESFLITNGLYLVDEKNNNVYYLQWQSNANYYAIQLNEFPVPTALPTAYSNPASMTFPVSATCPQVIISSNNFQNTVGFVAGTFGAGSSSNESFLSTFTPQISVVQSLLLSCTLLNNRYSNPSTILSAFTTQGVGFGSLISFAPTFPQFVNIQDGQYTDFTIQFLDQSFNPVPINDTNIVVQLLIKNPDKI